jgi:sulfonate dioxygenase
MTPSIGSEVRGLQLTRLANAGKDQLALLVARRKLVVFQDQDFADLPIQEALDFAAYFGRPYIHLTSGSPEGFPEVHLVHRGAGDKGAKTFMANRISSVGWHCDSSFEEQPPGTTILYVLEHPKTGGDTLFVDQVEAYNNLSPEFQKRLHGLKAVHSGKEQAQFSRNREGIVKREPATNEHPIVRTHPATGEKALFVNKSCRCSQTLCLEPPEAS